MADGPGKYDDITTAVRLRTGASAVVVIVLNGEHGSGFSVQAAVGAGVTPARLADLLRQVASEIESSALS